MFQRVLEKYDGAKIISLALLGKKIFWEKIVKTTILTLLTSGVKLFARSNTLSQRA